jgi:hypothetical protein
MNVLIRIQSLVRGLIVRKQVSLISIQKARALHKPTFTNDSESNYTTFIEINTSQIVKYILILNLLDSR